MVFEERFGTFECEDLKAMLLKLANQRTAAIDVSIHHVDCAFTAGQAHAESFLYMKSDCQRARHTG